MHFTSFLPRLPTFIPNRPQLLDQQCTCSDSVCLIDFLNLLVPRSLKLCQILDSVSLRSAMQVLGVLPTRSAAACFVLFSNSLYSSCSSVSSTLSAVLFLALSFHAWTCSFVSAGVHQPGQDPSWQSPRGRASAEGVQQEVDRCWRFSNGSKGSRGSRSIAWQIAGFWNHLARRRDQQLEKMQHQEHIAQHPQHKPAERLEQQQ